MEWALEILVFYSVKSRMQQHLRTSTHACLPFFASNSYILNIFLVKAWFFHEPENFELAAALEIRVLSDQK